MQKEQRVCVVLRKSVSGGNRYGVLKRTKNWEGWELVKGHIDDDESPEDAAVREVREETGIDEIDEVASLDYELTWTYERDGEQRRSVCRCFLIDVPADAYIDVDTNPHDEHATGHFLNFRDARDILTYDNQRELLEYVREEH